MTRLLCSVDVGVKYHARAWFADGVLSSADLVKDVDPVLAPVGGHEWDLVIECATVRQRDGMTKKREVDALNRAAGRLGANHPSPIYKLPEEWKGNLPKKVDQQRTLAALIPEELACLPTSKAELHHILDAIGLGLKTMGRR